MGMTFNKSLDVLTELHEDYQQFQEEVWQNPECHGIVAEALKVAIETMRKYQKIQKIVKAVDEREIGYASMMHYLHKVMEDKDERNMR